jgi:hypothetical protein
MAYRTHEDVARCAEHALMYPYDCIGTDNCTRAEWAALAVLNDLCGRRGIKQALESVDNETRCDIVNSLARIVEFIWDS